MVIIFSKFDDYSTSILKSLCAQMTCLATKNMPTVHPF